MKNTTDGGARRNAGSGQQRRDGGVIMRRNSRVRLLGETINGTSVAIAGRLQKLRWNGEICWA